MSCCKEFEPNIQKVNDVMVKGAMFDMRLVNNKDEDCGYNGKPFTHCPWCGTKLEDE